jgi:hypothetical protein
MERTTEKMFSRKWWLCWKISVQCVREINFFHSDITVIILHCQKLISYNWRHYLSKDITYQSPLIHWFYPSQTSSFTQLKLFYNSDLQTIFSTQFMGIFIIVCSLIRAVNINHYDCMFVLSLIMQHNSMRKNISTLHMNETQ